MRPNIKITNIQTFLVGVGSRNLVFVKVLTDQGIHGIGEAYWCGPDELTVAVSHFKRWLVGQYPRNIEQLWATMYNFTRFPGGSVVNAAISGIEHALWDIAGKAAGLPVYMLLGQARGQDQALPERRGRRAEAGGRGGLHAGGAA